MGQYASNFTVPDKDAVTKHTNPKKANWITVHAVSSELSIAEVERLWYRFQQLGCNENGEIPEADLQSLPIQDDAFSRNILKKFMVNKKVTFENFVRGLKWCELSSVEEKVRGLFRMLYNSQPIPKAIFTKILERVYSQPQDKQNIGKTCDTIYKLMDPKNSGQIQEDGFVAGCMSLEEDMLESILDFQILPNYMKEKLHQNLPEFSSQTSQRTPGGDIPSDETLEDISARIYNKDLERLANKLGLVKDDIDEIRDIYNERQEQAYQMLKKWKQREGPEAYSSVLEKALRSCGMGDAAMLLGP